MSPIVLALAAALSSLATRPADFDPAAVREFREAAISPDGALVAYVEDLLGPDGVPDGSSAVFVARASANGSWSHRRVSTAPVLRNAIERELAWAPDSRSLAFVSDGASAGQLQVYVVAIANGIPAKPRALTHLRGDMRHPEFSPDGSRLAFLWAEDAPRIAGPLEAMTASSGEIDSQIFEQRLAVVPTGGGVVEVISPADLYVHDFCWSPDGTHLAGVAAPGAGDANWWTARLDTFEIATRTAREIYRPTDQIARPRWSPDGKSIAFVEGLMSDEDSTGGDLFVVPASGGPARNLTSRAPLSVAWLEWALDSGSLLVCADRNGGSTIERVPDAPDRVGQTSEIWRGEETLKADHGPSLSLSRDQTQSAAIRSSFMSPPEIWAGPTGHWSQVTRENDGVRPAWTGATSVAWENDGWHLQGWLLQPATPSGAKAPMVVQVHGGPASVAGAWWPRPETAALAAAGYYVFLPNPRGSYGQGEEFTRANVRDFGYGDFRDILSGVEAVVGKASVDPGRVGIWGWSYGGYMTMWAVTQTRRFRAAVAGAGLANWESYYGENDIDEWMIPYFGASVYDDPHIYARSSPMTFIKNVKTPTLMLVGERDGECPASQSFEFWHALKTLGVPTSLVVYAGEGHAFRKGINQRDRQRRIVDWFDKYLKAPN